MKLARTASILSPQPAGSITLAAERINISQPSISTAISQLEAELGAGYSSDVTPGSVTSRPAGKCDVDGLLDDFGVADVIYQCQY